MSDPYLVAASPVTRRLFGLCLDAEHEFANHVPAVRCRPDLWLRYRTAEPLPGTWDAGEPTFRSPAEIRPGIPFLAVHQVADTTVFRFTEVVDFFVRPEGIEVLLRDPDYAYMVELHLLGFVMSFWLERSGTPALHASAVAWPEGAVGFLATNKGGKSSLAAASMRAGASLLSDDVLPLEGEPNVVRARPAYPQMRMWRTQAAFFVEDADQLARVHPHLDKVRIPVGEGGFGTFEPMPRPLRALYLPERGDVDEVRIEPMGFAAAVAALARHSFLAGMVDRLLPVGPRLQTLAQVARRVPVARFVYPSGMDSLSDVVQNAR